jgi:hypothetical protein
MLENGLIPLFRARMKIGRQFTDFPVLSISFPPFRGLTGRRKPAEGSIGVGSEGDSMFADQRHEALNLLPESRKASGAGFLAPRRSDHVFARDESDQSVLPLSDRLGDFR